MMWICKKLLISWLTSQQHCYITGVTTGTAAVQLG